jgi:hypothetical protein
MSFLFVGPKFVPPELVASYPHARGRWPGTKISSRRKSLRDDPRPDHFPVPLDRLAVGLFREYSLGDGGDHQWIDHPQDQRRDDRHQHGDDEIARDVHIWAPTQAAAP